MQREELYLQDIVEAVDTIESFPQQVSKDKFVGNELLAKRRFT